MNITALEAELDLLTETNRINSDRLILMLDEILHTYFTDIVDAVILRRWFNHGSWKKSVQIYFEIGFKNEQENCIDFGSDTSFAYDFEKGELEVNYGTCGCFTKKDQFQFKRAKLISNVYDNVDLIEDELKQLSQEACNAFYDTDVKIAEVEHNISKIEHETVRLKKKSIEESICVGDHLSYSSTTKCRTSCRLFNTRVQVLKITPKYVVTTDGYNNKRFRKDEVVNHIFNGYIKVNEEV